MTSQTSRPVPATWARRPAGPSTYSMPGIRRILSASLNALATMNPSSQLGLESLLIVPLEPRGELLLRRHRADTAGRDFDHDPLVRLCAPASQRLLGLVWRVVARRESLRQLEAAA